MEWATVMQAVIVGVASGGSCYAAMRVELKWLRRDVDEIRTIVFKKEAVK